MKIKLINKIVSLFIKHIDTILDTRDKDYLNKIGNKGLSNEEELVVCRETLLKTFSKIDKNTTLNLIEVWANQVDGMNYKTHDFVPFTKIFTKRVLDFYYQSKTSRKALIDEVKSFRFESANLDLTKTIINESIIKEYLRQIVMEHDPDSWGFILEQSKILQKTLIEYFEGLFDTQKEELKSLNIDLENKVAEKNRELLYNLYYDKLTNLPNLNAFERDTKDLEFMSVVLLNIDGFGKISSVYGYAFANESLIAITKKMQEIIDEKGDCKLYKYHGDRFLLLAKNQHACIQNLEDTYKKIVSVFEKESIYVNNEKIFVSFTAGISTCKKEPIQFAELAYQQAKDTRCSYLIYDESSNPLEEYKKNEFALKIIKYAIEKELVFPYFQLIRDNKNPKKKKYESLMRLEDPYGNVFSPFIFMDVAKDAKLYNSLARIMMRKSIETFEKVDAGFSINLEVEDVLNPKTMEYLSELIKKHKVQDKIILEITESENIKDFQAVIKTLNCFKDIGVKIAIDDFGSGYSNFSYLTEFDFDYIKIDGSLIKNLDTDKSSLIIAEMIVNFAKQLNKEVIAEFIDKEEVQKVVENLGIDYSQGYLFSKPSTSLI